MIMSKTFLYKEHQHRIDLQSTAGNKFDGNIDEQPISGDVVSLLPQLLRIDVGKGPCTVHYVDLQDQVLLQLNGKQIILQKPDNNRAGRPGAAATGEDVTAVDTPMPGKILNVFVSTGQSVQKGERLFIVEAMKMENEVVSPRDAVVKAVNFKENDLVSLGEPVVEFEV